MSIGIQEFIALLIVAVIVSFALYRRWRRKRDRATGCSSCADGAAAGTGEKKIHLYRRED